MRKPLIPLTLAFLCGILAGRGFLYFPFSVLVLGAIALAAAAAALALRRVTLRALLLVSLPCLIGAASSVYAAGYFPPDHYTRVITFGEARHEITGRIVSPLDRDPGRTAFVLAVETIDGNAARGALRVSVRDERVEAGYGDIVSVSCRIYEPRGSKNPGGFDYPDYLASRGIYATASVKDNAGVRVLKRGSGVFRQVQAWRERIRQAFLASTTGPGSAVLQAMTLGEEGGLTDDIRDAFMAAGVTHILSISGSHLGLVALLCFGLIRWSGFLLLPERLYHRLTLRADPKKIAAWLTIPPVVFYALLAGGQVATIRSLVMILAALAAVILDRESELLSSLAVAALVILLAQPQALFDISFQLSYLSVLAIGFVVQLWNELRLPAGGILPKLRNSVALLLFISVSTAVATGPLVAFYFNQVSLAGVLANMVIVPVAGLVVVPLGLLSGILSLFSGSLPLAALNQAAAHLFYQTVVFFSRLPFAQIHPPAPGLFWLAAYAVMVLAGAGMLRARLLFARRPLEYPAGAPKHAARALAASGMALIALSAVSALPQQQLRATFVDVGQGDCALLELPRGKTIMIDGGGTADNRFDIGRRVVAPLLRNRGIRSLDLVVLSHPHPDHVNGLLFIVRHFGVREVWASGLKQDRPSHADLVRILRERGIPLRPASAADPPVTIGNTTLTVLHPDPGFSFAAKKAYQAENNRSLVLRMGTPGMVMLFAGDIQQEAEAQLVRSGRDLRCDLLKVPHHGSAGSSSSALIEAAKPSLAIISVGSGNRYRQPASQTLERYARAGVSVYRTDRDGAVTVTLTPQGPEVAAWAGRTLQRISLDDVRSWKQREQENGKRLWLRKWGI